MCGNAHVGRARPREPLRFCTPPTPVARERSLRLCHSAKVEFTKINFDHNRRTKFPLDGVHADPKKAPCYSCHPKG